MTLFIFLVLLIKQYFKDFGGVVDAPGTTIKIDKTNSPRTGAEGGGLGGRLRSAVATIRNFLKSMTHDLIDGAKTFYTVTGATPILRRVRVTIP